jgi:hypothetical protein
MNDSAHDLSLEKLCRVEMRGCGKWKRISDLNHHSDFTIRKRRREKDGAIRLEYNTRCKECQRKVNKQKDDYIPTNGKHGVKAVVMHTGPEGVERLFFCKVKPCES